MTTKTVYLVEFKGDGYYAKKQPTYEWCFTPNPEEATQYASLATAEKRGLQRGQQFRIVEMRIKTLTEVMNISDWTSKLQKYAEKKVANGPAEKITLASLTSK